jgi:hypothetical protein
MKTQSNTKRRGRPPKSSGQLQTRTLDVRVAENEKDAFRAAAELAGMPVSMWVRTRLRAAARKELDQAGKPVAFLP